MKSREILLLFILILYTKVSGSQTLYIIPSIKGEFSGLANSPGHDKNNLLPGLLNLDPQLKLDLLYKKGKIYHKIGLETSGITEHFRVENTFMKPPNEDRLLGYLSWTHKTGPFSYWLTSYGLQNDGKTLKGFLFHSKIRFNYYGGLGIAFLRKNIFAVDSVSENGGIGLDNYIHFYSKRYRNGGGLFIKLAGGFDFISRKGKRSFNIGAYFNQGLKRMVQFDLSYEYGYFSIPQKQVKVEHQKIHSRGTTFGMTFGVPIYIR